MIPIQQDGAGLIPKSLRDALGQEGSVSEIRSKSKGVPKVFINIFWRFL